MNGCVFARESVYACVCVCVCERERGGGGGVGGGFFSESYTRGARFLTRWDQHAVAQRWLGSLSRGVICAARGTNQCPAMP